jgi:hypothetical protein
MIRTKMLRKFTKAVLVGAVAMLAIDPSAAQTGGAAQTPENAHKFLVVALNGTVLEGVGLPISYVGSSACSTQLQYRTGARTNNTYINWSIARKILVEGATIDPGGIIIYGGRQGDTPYTMSYKIVVGTPEMATRVQKAMEVIRVSCDKTQGLGF